MTDNTMYSLISACIAVPIIAIVLGVTWYNVAIDSAAIKAGLVQTFSNGHIIWVAK